MSAGTFWHNRRCSKSRTALALLHARGIEPVLVHYLDAPPDAAELRRVIRLLGIAPRALLRRGEDAYSELGLEDGSRDDDAIVAAMAAHPRLIERPVYIRGRRAVIGRPPERVLEIV